jgi:hypothetical protein
MGYFTGFCRGIKEDHGIKKNLQTADREALPIKFSGLEKSTLIWFW